MEEADLEEAAVLWLPSVAWGERKVAAEAGWQRVRDSASASTAATVVERGDGDGAMIDDDGDAPFRLMYAAIYMYAGSC